MFKKFFKGLYHFCWYAFAFIIISAAVLATVVRLALPEIGGYKDEIQSWVSEYMDYPIVIDEINAEWHGWTPQLYLKKIDLYTVDNSSLITKFDSAYLGINLIASLNQGELVPTHLSISGLDLEFTRNTDGSISINNDDNQNTNPDNNSALSEWLLKQKHIVLENTHLTWHDKKGNKEKQKFSNVQLQLKTHQQRIQLEAYIALPKQQGESITMKVDAIGNILTPDWNGSVYFEANEISPTDLLSDLAIKSIGGKADIKLWSNWNKSKLIDISGEMHYSNFSLNTDEYNLSINNIKLNLFGERKDNKDWLINLAIEDLQTSNGLWPASNYQLKIQKNNAENNYQYSGFLSFLKLEEILPFIIASNNIPEDVLEKIHWQSIKGELSNTNFNFNTKSKTEGIIQLNTIFKNLDLVSNDKNNAIYGLEGTLNVRNDLTKIILNSKDPAINFGTLFDKPFLFSKIDAHFELIHNDTFELLIKNLHIEDKFISVTSSGKIKFNEKSPFINVVAHMDEANIENLPAYLPKQTPAALRDWFIQALIGGNLLSADLIFRGDSADFPFKNSNGIFKTIMNVENATFDYAEGWPHVDKLTAEVIVDNDDLYVSAKSGYIFDATISGFTSNIIDMGQDNPHVKVHGSIAGHSSDAVNFIIQSPLNENAGLREQTKNISGHLDVKLDLDIPLDTNDTTVDGIISFSNTTIESSLPGLGLEGVNGDVSFTADAIWGENIDALYYGTPVKLNIPKVDPSTSGSKSYVISGMADKIFILNQLTTFFPSLYSMRDNISENFSGETKWSLTLSNSAADQKSDINEIELDTDLKGIAIKLPYPLGKTAAERRPLSIKTRLTDLSINKININYGNNIFTDLEVDNTENFVIKNTLIGLGQRHPETTTSNHISIQGELEELNVSEWIDFINPEKLSPSKKGKTNKQKRINGNIYVTKFNMLDNEFNNVNVNFNNTDNGWEILFDSEKLKGQTNFISTENNRLHADFEKLVLNKSKNNSDGLDNKNTASIAIDKIPELEVNVAEFVYNNNELGQLNLQTSNIENGISINNLSIIKPGFSIKATGEWLRIDDSVDRSDFHATLEADSIETMLSTFNFNTANIKEGQTSIEMNAYWMDTPMNFSMGKIDGELAMNIGKGQFLDIDPSAGRLFGLLSLQTLPRRLSLDFSDLFNEGFAFDNIEGNFSLQQGHAYTNDLEMNGPAANIIISGRTGLTTEDYDQIATITPKISSGLPVASALFGPIGIGVGAVFYLAGEIFESIPKKINEILKLQYTITGSWDDPSIEKIEKEKDSG